MVRHEVSLRLPAWVDDFLASTPPPAPDRESRMRYVLALARRNVAERTGGPFAAAVFRGERAEPVSVGVNRVVDEHCSIAHAEILALSLAQQEDGGFDLGTDADAPAVLVTTSQMCSMCLGDVCWSGVREVVWSTTSDDVEGIVGFDEGPMPDDVEGALARRGIHLVPDVVRADGLALLRSYVDSGGPVYNASRSPAG